MHLNISGLFGKILLVSFIGFLAWAYQATRPPAPKLCGSPDGPPITAPRIKLSDGRYLAYKEHGVPKDKAAYKIVYVHGFDSCRHDAVIANNDVIESLGVYIVSFDRPGYGESDPNPKRTEKGIALDIEELADALGLGSKFYVVGFSMGGQVVWTCLKYIPHRYVHYNIAYIDKGRGEEIYLVAFKKFKSLSSFCHILGLV
nr:Lysophospholipase BODYGUARD 2 precursor [Ipomoea batatas]